MLSGTQPLACSAEVEEALTNSRSQQFAQGEDIKNCQAEIIHNAAAPVLVEAALQTLVAEQKKTNALLEGQNA